MGVIRWLLVYYEPSPVGGGKNDRPYGANVPQKYVSDMSGNLPLFNKSSNFGVEGYDSGLKCVLKRRKCLRRGNSPPRANAIHTFIYKKGRIYALPSCTASGDYFPAGNSGSFPDVDER